MTDEMIVERARAASVAELPGYIGRLAEADAIARARLSAPAPIPQTEEKLLNIKQASEILGCSIHWLRRHNELPFVRHVGSRVLFHSGELQKFIRQRR
ncbi:MAG: helix-turn-helix domain-containing protein [Terriglobales bacterium]